jgi:hypothetical protein
MFNNLQREGEVSKKGVYPKEPNQAEVPEHAVQRLQAVISYKLSTTLISPNTTVQQRNDTYAISSALLPCCSAMRCSLIFDFWMRE